MSDETDNLVLSYLRRLDQRTERLADDMREVRHGWGIWWNRRRPYRGGWMGSPRGWNAWSGGLISSKAES